MADDTDTAGLGLDDIELTEREVVGDGAPEVAPDTSAEQSQAPATTVAESSEEKPDSSTKPRRRKKKKIRPRVDAELKPFCPVHVCSMKHNARNGNTAYYKCPVPGCESTAKLVAPRVPIPAGPSPCPKRICREGGKEHFLEVDPTHTHSGQILLCCPNCGHQERRPAPQLYLMKMGNEPKPTVDER